MPVMFVSGVSYKPDKVILCVCVYRQSRPCNCNANICTRLIVSTLLGAPIHALHLDSPFRRSLGVIGQIRVRCTSVVQFADRFQAVVQKSVDQIKWLTIDFNNVNLTLSDEQVARPKRVIRSVSARVSTIEPVLGVCGIHRTDPSQRFVRCHRS